MAKITIMRSVIFYYLNRNIPKAGNAPDYFNLRDYVTLLYICAEIL